ncbi:ankyrin repeat protein [Stella humosa]|uniref:Ankyrin repeat protein n=1 Tax=Stella humosa TaxID=94 RepID=A0A3N1LWV6_9PROT|nr:ankyrin repeat domain-containing protein [Stella humosa]ROP99663.1 ankyrin repeat protein [Stella humosa]BBK31112.1 hypothetical protein STHU_17460 [Stella humosa]
MARRFGPRSTVDSLKKAAKSWLRQLRAGDAAARGRLIRAWPGAPDDPGLRDVQHALAREYGLAGWTALREALAVRALAGLGHRERVDIVLHHVWEGDPVAAARILGRYPEIARDSLHAAVVCGDRAEVSRRLAADPAGANATGGPLNWPPLLYLAFARLPVPPGEGDALAIATALLDAGADPNARFSDDWDNPFTVLTGVIGQGEQGRPPHPDAPALVDLLVARGADPFDTQALYDTSLVRDDPEWLEILHGASTRRGDAARWTTKPPGGGIGGKFQQSAIDYLLGNAVTFDHPRRVDWLLRHGADPDGVNSYSGLPHHAVARLAGFGHIADLLVRHGARPVPLADQQAFQAACMMLDATTAAELAARDPACLADPEPLLMAAAQGRVAVIDLLLGLGAPVDGAREDGMRPLHAAAQHGHVAAAARLIAAGADLDRRGSRHNATPLGFAVHGGFSPMIDLLAPRTRDPFDLCWAGRVDRLGELFDADPGLAAVLDPGGGTLLFLLPDDEDAAVAVAALLLARGVDPRRPNAEGKMPAHVAGRRGLDEAAEIIAAAARASPRRG